MDSITIIIIMLTLLHAACSSAKVYSSEETTGCVDLCTLTDVAEGMTAIYWKQRSDIASKVCKGTT